MSRCTGDMIRLFKCYVETVQNLIGEFADDRLLRFYGRTLQSFLNDEIHFFFHQVQQKHILCCECPAAGCTITQTRKMDQKMFNSLYDTTGTVDKSHEIIQGGCIKQRCIHKYTAKGVVLDDLDITMVCYLLLTRATLTPLEKTHIETVREYRNKICHEWKSDHYDSSRVNTIWADLEAALYGLSTKPMRNVIKMAIQGHKMCDIGKEEYTTLLEKLTGCMNSQKKLQRDFSSETKKATRKVCAQVTLSENCIRRAIQAESTAIQENQRNEAKNMYEKVIECVAEKLKRYREGEVTKTHHTVGNVEVTIKYPDSMMFIPSTMNEGDKLIWHIETPSHWNIQEIEATLIDNSKMESQPIKIKFVKKGSIWLLTTVPSSLLSNSSTFESGVTSFLSTLIEVCSFDTSIPCKVKVFLSVVRESQGGDLAIIDVMPKKIQKSTQTETSALASIDCIFCQTRTSRPDSNERNASMNIAIEKEKYSLNEEWKGMIKKRKLLNKERKEMVKQRQMINEERRELEEELAKLNAERKALKRKIDDKTSTSDINDVVLKQNEDEK